MPREGYLTASQFAAALGLNPYMSRVKLFRQLTGAEPRFAGNAATAHGNATEPVALAAYEVATGLLVDGRQKWFEAEHYGTHVDGITCIPGEDTSMLVEAKCPTAALYPAIPGYYIPQVIGQQWLANIDRTDFVAYFEGALRVWRVHHDADYAQWMLETLNKFWEDTLAGREPPRKKPAQPEFNLKIERVI